MLPSLRLEKSFWILMLMLDFILEIDCFFFMLTISIKLMFMMPGNLGTLIGLLELSVTT